MKMKLDHSRILVTIPVMMCVSVDIFYPLVMIGILSNFYEWSFLCEYSKQNLSIHYDGNVILFICITSDYLCQITTSGIKKKLCGFFHSGNHLTVEVMHIQFNWRKC